MLVSVHLCAGAKVLRDWGIVDINSDSTVSEVFHGLTTGWIESADGFRHPEQYANSPVSCSIAPSQTGRFQSIPLNVKIQDAVEFGKFLKFVLQHSDEPPTLPKNAFAVLTKEAGRQMWPDKYELTRSNNRQKLHNDIIEYLRAKELGWSKENVLSAGKPFVTQLGDILWRLDGHHDKLAAQQCAVPSIFFGFQEYNVPENYKQKRPNLKRENIAAMLQTLFDILQQVS